VYCSLSKYKGGTKPHQYQAGNIETARASLAYLDLVFDDMINAVGLCIGVGDTTDMIETAATYACDKFMTIIEGVKLKITKQAKWKPSWLPYLY
tara:strand:- start:8570 stop:8851 length:282 start_codon:yes stop_codon:yes gene_type:complete